MVEAEPIDDINDNFKVTTLVHPLDPAKHNGETGFRWGVYRGNYLDVTNCANAGVWQDRREAIDNGDQNAASAVMLMRLFGLPIEYRGVVELDFDPVPESLAPHVQLL